MWHEHRLDLFTVTKYAAPYGTHRLLVKMFIEKRGTQTGGSFIFFSLIPQGLSADLFHYLITPII